MSAVGDDSAFDDQLEEPMSEQDSSLRTVAPAHARLLDYVRLLKVQLNVLRLTSHVATAHATDPALERAAAEYDEAQRHLDLLEGSVARAQEERAKRAS